MAILSNVKLSDRIEVPSQRTLTDAGQMHVPCAFARTGSQEYSAKSLGLSDLDPKEAVTVWRDEADVFAEDSMSTFRSAPVTLGHPKDAEGKAIAVTAENSKDLQVGMLEGMPTRDEDTLSGTLILSDQAAIDALEEGTQELSAGYMCDIEEIDGKYFQRNIRANHIAIVAKGRAGSSCRVADEEEVVMISDEAHKIVVDELAEAKAELDTQKQLVVDFKEAAEKAEVAVEKIKVELADAEKAASEGVIERCQVIEDARLIADMRDLGSKSIADIKRMVVEDQMPEKDLSGKSEPYIAAMFELLGDASKGETPMGKLLRTQTNVEVADVKPAGAAVLSARDAMIARQSK